MFPFYCCKWFAQFSSTATSDAFWLMKNVLLSLKNMKNYYNFMFFSTVCSSFTESKCMLQKLEDPIKWLGIYQTPQKLQKFCETRIRKKVINLPTQKNRIWPILKLWKIGRASQSLELGAVRVNKCKIWQLLICHPHNWISQHFSIVFTLTIVRKNKLSRLLCYIFYLILEQIGFCHLYLLVSD